MSKPRIATVWLDGCSGCHMSLLDLDERLLDIFERADLVYSPLVDFKEFPEDVDVCLVEGAVSSEEDLHKIQHGPRADEDAHRLRRLRRDLQRPGHAQPDRGRSRCWTAPTVENVTLNPQLPTEIVPKLLPTAQPVHRVVTVDVFLPGCPPHADLIYTMLDDLLAGRVPDVAGARFGR